MTARTQRVRDPVHGLIVFRADKPLDQLAWTLINTPEFQRLRRIKQLGVSEFVFPGATHSRFAHSLGVFHVARELVGIIKREIGAIGEDFDEKRSRVAVIAALLHDLGHGPFSHTFQEVRKSQGVIKRHEDWTGDIIRNPAGAIHPLLEAYWPEGGFCGEVADLLASEDPKDIYHAVVSSSLDADRLDYLRRDRLMTGTGAGAIDFDWLMEHVQVKVVSLEAADIDPSVDRDDLTGPRAPTFCLDIKALPAAEQFLLSRYTLHEQVYFHKTTRCVEHMIAMLLRLVARHARTQRSAAMQTGLPREHPLLRFFSKDGASLSNYLALDDVVVMGAFERMTKAADPAVSELARRLLERRLYKTLDIRWFGSEEGRQLLYARRIEKMFEHEIGTTVLKDEGASLSVYSQIGGDEERAHKKLRILDADGEAREISRLSTVIKALSEKKVSLTRYYFADESDRDRARSIGGVPNG